MRPINLQGAEVGRILVAGGAGVLALLILGLARAASPAPVFVAAILLAVLTAGLALGAKPTAQGPLVAPPGAPAANDLPYDRVLEALPEPVLLIGSETGASPRVLFANDSARDLFPIQGEGGLLAAAVRHPGALEVIEVALQGAASSAEFETGGAAERVWRILARPLPTQTGRWAVVILRDETDARRVERMRADFLANASHELRTPLASLTGFIETLQGPARDDAPARERFLGIMSEQAARMGRLINDLLSLSRIELNEHIIPSGRVDLSGVVRDVLDAMAPASDGAGAASQRTEIRTVLPPAGRALVRGDRDQLIQVAQNLVDNAIKYAGSTGVVTIEVESDLTADAAAAPRSTAGARSTLLSPDHAAGGRYAVLRVSDSGPGIAREHLMRLSERFFRVEGQKSGQRMGTGLGLAIVKHVLNRHRGGLVVESAPGQGATFSAYAPMAVAEDA